ncbi:MAG: PLP-dependent aspartate aminotransferase family protein [Spirochaetales bacterium]|nr:PLP-dependent aspartate aminotransferase family protein [Spirochaetales bacterium]
MEFSNYCFDTLCVQGSPEAKSVDLSGAISVPLVQSATFAHPGLGESTGYDYSRLSNPTRKFLEETVAALDGAKFGFAFSCGMAAETAFFSMLESKSHIISSDDIYGGSLRLFNTIVKKQGIETTFVDTSSLEQIEKAFRPDTKIVFIETPGNPVMTVTDIKKTAELAHSHGALLVVDNTFLTAYYQKPLALGADVVIQSGTKFLAGHNDVLAGFVTTNNEKIAEDMAFITKTTGSMLAPFDSWLTIRGIKTLTVRLQKQSENAAKLAQYLKTEKLVKKVLYIGLPETPGYEIHKSQASGFGSMISIYLDSSKTVERFLRKIRIFRYAESLGGVESLATYPLTQTHSEIPEEKRRQKGITDTLVRLSVGIENFEDLKNDIKQALED